MIGRMDKPLTPLGALLESAREAVRPKLSQNQAAKRAKTSSTTYRRVITGVARLGGRDVPFEGDPETIARIACVLDIGPEQVEEVGRDDVAYELRALVEHDAHSAAGDGAPVKLEARGYRSDIPSDEELRRAGLQPETVEAISAMRDRIARWIAEGDESQIRRAERVTEALDADRETG